MCINIDITFETLTINIAIVMCITVVFTIETLTINIAIEEDERYSGASSSKPWAPHDFSH